METLVGVWKGYRDEALSCEYLLKKAMGLPMMAVGEGNISRRGGSGVRAECVQMGGCHLG
jgi:hypothetical protein